MSKEKRGAFNAGSQLFRLLFGTILPGKLRRTAVSVSAGESLSGTTARQRPSLPQQAQFDIRCLREKAAARRRGTSNVFSKRWFILALVLAIFVGIIFVSNPIVTAVSPLMAVSDAASKTMTTLADRFETSPLVMLRILATGMQNGKITAVYDYAAAGGSAGSGDVLLLCDGIGRNFAANATLATDRHSTSCNVLLNQDRLAFKTARTDGGYYGITFDTYDGDLASFAEASGLSAETVATLNDLIVFLKTELHSNNLAAYEEYSTRITDFINDLEPVETRDDIMLDGKCVSCKAVNIELPESAVKKLVRDLYDIFKKDFSLVPSATGLQSLAAGLTGSVPQPGSSGVSEATPGEKLDAMLDYFETNFKGPINVTFHISGGTLVRCAATIPDISQSGRILRVTADFGKNPETDDLALSITDETDGTLLGAITLATNGDQDFNTNTLSFNYDGGSKNVTVTTDWQKNTGDLTLDIKGPNTDIHADGMLTVTTSGFALSFSDLPVGETHLALMLSAEEEGVTIPAPSYMNLNNWSPAFIRRHKE